MDTTATILAVSSPPGRSARGLVRISGPDAFRLIADRLVPMLDVGAVDRGMSGRRLRIGDHELPVLVLLAPGPGTATGEHIVEVQAPGNPDLLSRIVESLIGSGRDAGLDVRSAEPGEFTARGFFNGRCSLTEAEGVAATIAACSDAQLRAASMLRTGRLGAVASELSEGIAGVLALVEAGIDFSDEDDVVAITPHALLDRIGPVQARIEEVLDRSVGMERLQSLPQVVLCGPPNAGKSTLFNAMLGRERAVVSGRPGTTRDVLREPLDVSGGTGPAHEVLLVDLAGLDPLDPSPMNLRMQSMAQDAIESADLLLVCSEPGGEVVHVDDERVLRVQTKSDLATEATHDAASVCARSGEGLGALRDRIRARLSDRVVHLEAHAMALQPRHEAELREAMEGLQEVLAIVEPERSAPALPRPELVASSLRRSLDATASLAGDLTPDDILGRIFASFCIGK